MRPTIFAAALETRRSLMNGAAAALTLSVLLGTIACSGSGSSTGPGTPPDPVGTSEPIQIDRSRAPVEIFHARHDDGRHRVSSPSATLAGTQP